jgi:hypothetical protein
MSYTLPDTDVPLVLAALDVAAEAKRDTSDACGCASAAGDDVCPDCQWRLVAADEWDGLAERIRETR